MAIYTVGYSAPGSSQELAALMADSHMLLIDIRLVPWSRRYPSWRKAALSAEYAPRYIHLPGLGNLNYKHRAKNIQLAAPDMALCQLRRFMERGYSLVLLCVCADYEHCHRRIVYDRLSGILCATNGEGEHESVH